jgi:signal transduction histidine kinase
MDRPIHILYLEDEPDFVELVRSLLEREGLNVKMVVVDNYDDFTTNIERNSFDTILGDYQLPRCNGLQALQAARQKAPDTPFLLVSGVIGERAAIDSLRFGATDYVLKSGIDRLVPAVHRAVHESQERKRIAAELKKAQGELAHTSRLAGMAEVATSVLHNVGNVLNSVNISASLVSDELKKSKIANIARVAALMREHTADIGDFMASDPRGKQLPDYLSQLAEHLTREQNVLLQEMEQIRKNLEHIKDIVAIQQNYAQISGVSETVRVTDLVEDALRMNAGALSRHDIKIVREYDPQLPEITVEKHKVLQVLVNLIRNAKYACDEADRPDKNLRLHVSNGGDRVRVAVADNGVGIPEENFAKIFNHGFTTRKEGHGFGLHSSLLAAEAMGGALSAHSDGPGKGATFTLELPVQSPAR